MRSLLLWMLAVAVTRPVEGRAAEVTLGCPATVRAGQQLTVEVTVDVGTTPLGASSITLTYDPAFLTVASAAGGRTTEFAGTPTTNTPTPGTTNVATLQAGSLGSPTGRVSVARITFDVMATASRTTTIGVVVGHLYGTDGKDIIPATGTGCHVAVTGAPARSGGRGA